MRPSKPTGATAPTPIESLAALDAALQDMPGQWSVETLATGAPVRQTLLVPHHGDRFAASYLLEQSGDAWVLTGHRWDRFGPPIHCANLQAVMTHLRQAAAAAARINGPTQLN